jgi:hypothetical protein
MKNLRCAAAAVLLFATGCPDVDTDPGEGPDDPPFDPGPLVEFDPSASIIPFPNNLVIDPATGRVTLPQQRCESPTQTAIREGVLNTLDGFGTFKTALQFTLTEPVDPASLTGNVTLYQRTSGTMALDPATAMPVPAVVIPGQTTRRISDDCMMAPLVVDAVTIVPTVPLEESSMYFVAVTRGVETADPAAPAFGPSPTWQLVRQPVPPVTLDAMGNVVINRTPLDPLNPADLARLQGIARLWQVHAPALAFLAAKGVAPTDVLLAWEFRTQTTTRPHDPTVAGSLAADLPTTPLQGATSLTGGDTQGYLNARLGAATCAQVGCAAVGDVLGAVLVAPDYQRDTPNPLAGGAPIPGAWSDPYAPALVRDAQLEVVAFVPAGTPPANGWPTIVFGHGLTRSKNTLIAIAPQLASQGFASVAIDFVAHGSRAVQTSTDPGRGCLMDDDPERAPQCFSPILSSDLAATRDNLRQTALDLQRLIIATSACTANACGGLAVDADRIGYLGMSLGGIIGAMVVAESELLQAGVTNVAAMGLLDIVENTDTVALRCTLIDALIAAGIVVGDPWDPGAGTGICLTEDWKTQAGYRTFANIARWVLDPADGANYARKLATRVSLLQEVLGDLVVPNEATDQMGALTGRTAVAAAPATGLALPPPPSPAIVANPNASKWLTYADLPPDPGTGFPGNDYHHGSLLVPPGDPPYTTAGRLATAQMQTDAITFLFLNVAN